MVVKDIEVAETMKTKICQKVRYVLNEKSTKIAQDYLPVACKYRFLETKMKVQILL